VSPAYDDLGGEALAEMKARLAGVEPDPVAARYFNLPPEDRLRAVQNERGQ
jgi:hypothetical protein